MPGTGAGTPTEDLLRRSRLLSNPASVAYTGTHGRLGPLAAGMYSVVTSTDAFVLQGGSAVAATASSNPAWLKVAFPVYVSDDLANSDSYISAIQSSAGGTLYATRLD